METTTEFIERLRSDSEAYTAAKIAEGEAWGEQFGAERLKQVRADDARAALQLRPGRHGRSFGAVARSHGWHFDRGLSLACGSGGAERELIAQGICKHFVGIDVSEAVLVQARAAVSGLPIEYRIGDLNEADLGSAEFDLVVAQNCLHHVLELEFLEDQIWRCLKPGGMLWIDDFIGETQFQWNEERLRIVNEILAILPPRYRRFRLHDFTIEKFQRPEVAQLASPFEAIRSGEIVSIFKRRFLVEWENQYDSVMQLLCPVGARANYLETEDGPVLFDLLMLLDRLLIENGVLAPLAGQYALRKRA
jgi:SAM-dependent methyltransferase